MPNSPKKEVAPTKKEKKEKSVNVDSTKAVAGDYAADDDNSTSEIVMDDDDWLDSDVDPAYC